MLWRLLLAFFHLGVGDPETPPETPAGETPAEETPAGDEDDESLETLLDSGDEVPETPEAKRARERQREIETIAEETARRVVGPKAPAPNYEQSLREQEDAQLEALRRAGGTAQQVAEKQWEINTNRTLRQSDEKSSRALLQSLELNDKAEFRELASDPKQQAVYRAYRDRVEKELAEMRKSGNNVARKTLMYYLYGKDKAEGKLKVKTAAKKEPAEELPRNVTRIERGRAPAVGARGDVGGSGKTTRRQDLEKRLDGKLI